jgi:putative addiction module component (TIGR02574 family)
MSVPSEIYSQAMELPVDQREELAHRLLDSLHTDNASLVLDAAFEAEVERRVKSIEDGTATVIDMDVSIAKLRARSKNRPA